MKALFQAQLLLATVFVVACSQNSSGPQLQKFSMEENSPGDQRGLIQANPIPRAIPVEDPEFQELANAMVGKPSDDRDAASGVYQKWSTGGRGFYNPANRKLYENFIAKNLTRARNETKTVYYPFGGPDVVYPLTFFPHTTTLILVGTEPIGKLPSIEVAESAAYQESINTMMEMYLGSSFYVTKDMDKQAKESPSSATWAKMMAAIALLDLRILTTETGTLSAEGVWLGDDHTPVAQRNPLSPKGVSFLCLRRNGQNSEYVTIYYFQQNLGESKYGDLVGLPKSIPFLNFLATLRGNYTSFLKAASYLSHDTASFRTSNDLVFGGNKIVQAPSGVPFSEFAKRKSEWNLTLFGEYREPSESFAHCKQEDLREAYRAAIEEDRRGDYADFVSYGGRLPFHYDYGTGPGGRAAGTMLFYGIRSKR